MTDVEASGPMGLDMSKLVGHSANFPQRLEDICG